MATGTTADYTLDRNSLITLAYRKIGITANSTLITNGIDVLNSILREEDLKGTGPAKNLWAVTESTLKLSADGFVYSTTEGLESAILDLVTVFYRNTSGDDTQVEIIDSQQYAGIADKDSKGDVQKVFLKPNLTLSSQLLYVWPAPDSVGTTSEVTGTDALNYSCIMGHTGATTNRPITGADWRLYWRQTGSSGSAWAADSSYTNGELLRYVYKRPLYDFDTSTDNPDMPSGWIRYLTLRLAHDFCPEFDVDMDSRVWLKREYLEARADLFNSTRPQSTDFHNKTVFY